MSIAAHAEAIKAHLTPWARKYGGEAFVASDLVHLWKIAFNTTLGPRVALCWDGEAVRGDDSIAAALGRVDRHWILMVARGRGFNAERGDSLTKKVQNAPPLYTLVEEARDIIRTMLDVSVELPVNFKSIEPMQKMDDIVDAYLIKFSTAVDLPHPSASENVVVLYYSSPQSYTATCSGGQVGDPVTVTTTEGQFVSQVSQAEADALALAYATEQATAQLECVTPPSIPLRGAGGGANQCEVYFFWTGAGEITSFTVQRAFGSVTLPPDGSFSTIASGAPDSFATNPPGLGQPTAYYIADTPPVASTSQVVWYRVQATGPGGTTAWKEQVYGTLPLACVV